jgi:hypothetical protein
MPYQPIILPNEVPLNVRSVVEGGVDPMLREVHTMLSISIDEDGRPRQFQHSIANTLLAVISGVSSTLYAKDLRPGEQFVGVLVDHFPWTLDPPTGATPQEAVRILYDDGRNPIAHRVGMHRKGSKPVELGMVFGRTPEEIDAMAVDPSGPSRPSIVVREDVVALWLGSLYWSVRRMIHNLLADRSRVIAAEQWLRKGGFLPAWQRTEFNTQKEK